MDDITEFDNEAADRINQGQRWKDVHDAWEQQTRRDLSPAAFGRRILKVIEKRTDQVPETTPIPTADSARPNAPAPQPQRSSGSTSAAAQPQMRVLQSNTQQTNGAHRQSHTSQIERGRPVHSPHHPPLQPAPQQQQQQQQQQNQQQHPPQQHHHQSQQQEPARPSTAAGFADAQRSDVERLELAINQVRNQLQDVERRLQDIQQRSLPGVQSRGAGDEDTLEMLSQTVANVSTKAGEIDSLKIAIDLLKRRVKRLEGDGPDTTPSQRETQSSNNMTSHPPPRQPIYPTPVSAIAPQTLQNEPVSSGGWNAVNTAKRKASIDQEEAMKRVRADSFARNGLPPLQHRSSIEGMPQYGPPRFVSTQDDESQAGWRPRPAGPPPLMTSAAAPRGRGRPRKPTPPEYTTPVWGAEGWAAEGIDADNYYQTASGSPGALDRGGVIRRGSGGSFADQAALRRTRQKPIRNADGVLIRKDGKPDQRSISSPMNLKKVHARKMAELESGGSGNPGSPGSPMGESSAAASSGEGTSPDADDKSFVRRDIEASQTQSKDPHAVVMGKMFPNGVEQDTERHRHAEHYFSPSNGHGESRAQPREGIEKAASATAPAVAPSQETANPPLSQVDEPHRREEDVEMGGTGEGSKAAEQSAALSPEQQATRACS